MIILQTHALRVQAVEIRRLQPGIAMAGHVAVTLVVGDDEDDIRRRGVRRSGSSDPGREHKAVKQWEG